MKLKWLDVQEIGIELNKKFPNINPKKISFIDMHKKICDLDNFIDNPNKSNEKILEAIFLSWLDEFQ